MDDVTMVSVAELGRMVESIFMRAGFNAQQADAIARIITAAERDGAKSHGIYRIEGCLRTLAAGKVSSGARPELIDEGSAVIRVAADGGFSPAAFELGLPALAGRAEKLGLAALVINDCVHFSALWPEVEAVASRGLAGLAMCPSYAAVAPAGGTQPLLGTNPIAFGWPRSGAAPYVFDFATSCVARGEIELLARAGEPLPEGWALDAEGAPTTDAEAALSGAMLPFGGHKGSAISTMVELLAGVMIGDLTSQGALAELGTLDLAPKHGELILAFSPARFAAGRPGDPLARAEALFDAILGQGARLPGQRRLAARARSEAEGIALNAEELALIDRLQRDGLAALG
ncbi:Ldh family oxidoreductase [Paracoccus denitrificans]|jgi:LDH2 family malate/lactate/ureidoglycolate dehydrogenase|uniref:Malate/L-lactate dehydrogenase n=1 Tax=Paracoccus denitrificans (strain Pd 1222) TaxID=318586 RepID=A1B0K8_PARDP|nr:Ldh family oxidoreductase [Paracoccus denitrificans]ABL69052.1 Malate/L-lactate dehydrogenase [Paracoccus denitrificans PD1222]MBB4629873.1 LDH2 family malate/lactate/ureidoglycolate dehydrogenase [Paracoccus denitrificans]MCU7431269.1 Ldh family oxidoreductase [Paracoccus denitrificans]QAR27086.1 Ldh family oxidoreductase [Paracoccus denitrificans]UPV96048.1 Ldh family oxidoreductase [Paracoccus denitrificans]